MSELFMSALVIARHEKWSIFNGIIDDIEALAETKNKHASSAAAKRQREEAGTHKEGSS
jgi:hypothetical protein